MKKYHVLSPSKTVTFPRFVIYVDTETNLNKLDEETIYHTLKMGCAQFVDYKSKKTEDRIIFYTVKEFWEWVESKTQPNQTVWIIAHNQDFDFRVLDGFNQLHNLGYFPHHVIFDNLPCILTFGTEQKIQGKVIKNSPHQIQTKRKYIKCIDTLNFFRDSLASLGDLIGLEKLEMPSEDDSIEDWETYCMRDVDVMRQTLEQFWVFLKEYNLGSFKPTLAGQSLEAFKSKYLKHKIHIHTDTKANNIEREAYYGGRAECFRIGSYNSHVYTKLDINSMYPHVMQSNYYPIELLGTSATPENFDLSKIKEDCCYIAKCEVETELPLIPYKYNTRLVFPTGKFIAHLCQPEIELLQRHNQKVKILEIAVYKSAKIFTEFVDHTYKLRMQFADEGNEIYKYMIKILMNSLYGKFGQQSPKTEIVDFETNSGTYTETIIDEHSGKVRKFTVINGTVIEEIGREDGFDTFVAIPAFVTSYARVQLIELILKAGLENTFYCDTDSLFVNLQGLKNLHDEIDAKRLGALKIEGCTRHMDIYNLKDYKFGQDEKIKGVRKNAVKLSDNVYQVEQWQHFRGSLQRNGHPQPITKQTTKTLKREYLKGNVTPEGIVKPFHFYLDN